MKQHPPTPLVRFNVHMRRDHVHRLIQLAKTLAQRKGRDVRLGEALELALIASHAWSAHDLLDLAPADRNAPHWLQLGPVDRLGMKALVPAALRGGT